jgi:hypothetical protein
VAAAAASAPEPRSTGGGRERSRGGSEFELLDVIGRLRCVDGRHTITKLSLL